MISRPSSYGILDFNDDKEDDDSISYCKHCEKFGFKVPLRNRIYPNNEPIPPDQDQWRQCHECGSLVPIYELEMEPVINDFVETIDNPFDYAKDTMLGVASRTVRRKKRQKLDFDHIKELDLKKDLKKGYTLLSYSESMT
jgi:hypothetical protein